MILTMTMTMTITTTVTMLVLQSCRRVKRVRLLGDQDSTNKQQGVGCTVHILYSSYPKLSRKETITTDSLY